jgi:predicted component of type VI protein secretion system
VFHKFQEGFNAVEASMRLAGGAKWAAASSAQVVAPAGQQVATAPLGGAVAVASVSGGVTVGLSGREQSFHRLEEVAQWFEKHEPQSLIPYEVRKVLRRGRMKPEQLFMELIPDESARTYFFRDLGMEMPEQG